MKKLSVGILFGGRSAEHEVSIRSAQSINRVLDKDQYKITLIGITPSGFWHVLPQEQLSLTPGEVSNVLLNVEQVVKRKKGSIFLPSYFESIDIVFPVLHGPYGEDGTVQGFLKLLNIPFVGAGVLGSAVGMDKDIMKRLLRDGGIPIGKFIVKKQGEIINNKEIAASLGLPLFVKPANLGSSVGVTKVHTIAELSKAIETAFHFDTKILFEELIDCRELEVAVLGNHSLEVSVVGEIIPKHDFYSYEAKYVDDTGAELVIPAIIDQKTAEQVRELAKQVFRILECSDMARVDFFLASDGRIYVNEINTIPGFTSISMYPKLWEASGISYANLLKRLIDLALDRHEKQSQLKTSY
jgi:D-alanine-D-alanine ligase